MFINICKGCKLMYNLHKKRICTSLSVWKKLFGIHFKSTKELKIQILHRIVLASFFFLQIKQISAFVPTKGTLKCLW